MAGYFLLLITKAANNWSSFFHMDPLSSGVSIAWLPQSLDVHWQVPLRKILLLFKVNRVSVLSAFIPCVCASPPSTRVSVSFRESGYLRRKYELKNRFSCSNIGPTVLYGFQNPKRTHLVVASSTLELYFTCLRMKLTRYKSENHPMRILP